MKHSIEEIAEHSELAMFTPADLFDDMINQDLHLIMTIMTMIGHKVTSKESSCESAEDLLNCADWATSENKAMMFDATAMLFNLGEFGHEAEEFTDHVWMIDTLAQAIVDYNKAIAKT